MSEFYIIIARKIFFRIFWRGGGTWPHCPPSPTPIKKNAGKQNWPSLMRICRRRAMPSLMVARSLVCRASRHDSIGSPLYQLLAYRLGIRVWFTHVYTSSWVWIYTQHSMIHPWYDSLFVYLFIYWIHHTAAIKWKIIGLQYSTVSIDPQADLPGPTSAG